MLDYRTLSLLDIINSNCQSGGYKVFLINDLISAMPSAFKVDEQVILDCLEALKNHQYVSIKYQDDDEVCLLPLIKGKLESENRIDQEIEKIKSQKQYFWSGFLGASAGGAIIAVIVALVSLIGGK